VWADDVIKGKILHKLTRLGKFKHSHTSIDNLPKGFPKDLRGKVKNNIDELIKERILLKKSTNYGVEISINPIMRGKIVCYVDKFLNKE